jgi:hypothetical protein
MHPYPIEDHWSTIIEYRDLLAGKFGFADMWRLHNEHRIPVSRLFYFADYSLFAGSASFLILSIYVIQLAHACLLACVLRRWSGLSGSSLWIAYGLVFSLMMSAAQAQNLNWSFQVHFPLVFFAASVAFLMLSRSSRSARVDSAGARSWMFLACAILAASVSTFTVANGLLVWPMLVVLAVITRMPWLHVAALIVACVGVWSAYFSGFPAGESSRLSVIFTDPLGLLHFILLYLGGPVARIRGLGTHAFEIPVAAIGDVVPIAVGSGVIVLTIASAVSLVRRRTNDPLDVTCAALATFVIGTAVVTGLGRLGETAGVEYALQGRYGTPPLAAWAALVVLMARNTRQVEWRSHLARGCAIGMVACVIFSLLWWRQIRELPYAKGRFEFIERMTQAVIDGPIEDANAMAAPRGTPWLFLPSIAFLKSHELGIFADWKSRAAPGTPEEGLEYLGYHLSVLGDWGVGMPSVCSGLELPFEDSVVMGTWNAGNSSEGRLEISGFGPDRLVELEFSYVTSPNTSGLMARLLDERSGVVLADFDLSPAVADWRRASVSVSADVPAAALRLVLLDHAEEPGHWLGIALRKAPPQDP